MATIVAVPLGQNYEQLLFWRKVLEVQEVHSYVWLTHVAQELVHYLQDWDYLSAIVVLGQLERQVLFNKK